MNRNCREDVQSALLPEVEAWLGEEEIAPDAGAGDREQGGPPDEQLTPNFRLREFKSRRGGPIPPQYVANIRRLARNLQALRDALHRPIVITSGYRSPQDNSKVGGAKNSQHLYGRAADIRVGKMSPAQVYCAIERMISAGRMEQGGLGIYKQHVHYDVRGSRARWTGSGVTRPDCGRHAATSAPASAPTAGPSPKAADKPTGYQVVPGREYGPKWKAQRPPGLPASARKASRVGAALPAVEAVARRFGLGDIFVRAVTDLAKTESGGTYGLPNHVFVAPATAQAPGKYSTAWGVFQFNGPAWRRETRRASDFPWDCTPQEELARPIARYAALFSEITNPPAGAGQRGSALAGARGIRLWHRSPAVAYKQYLREGRRMGFDAAWQRIPPAHRLVIDVHLRKAGILV